MNFRRYSYHAVTLCLVLSLTACAPPKRIKRPDELIAAAFTKVESAVYNLNATGRAEQLRLTMDILNHAPKISWGQDTAKLNLSALDYIAFQAQLQKFGTTRPVKNQISKTLSRVSIGSEFLRSKTIYYSAAVESNKSPVISSSLVLFGNGPAALFPSGQSLKVEYQNDGFCYISSPKEKNCFIAMEDANKQAFLVSSDGVEHQVLMISNGDPLNIRKTAATKSKARGKAYLAAKSRQDQFSNCVDVHENVRFYSNEQPDDISSASSCLGQMAFVNSVQKAADELAHSHRERRIKIESDEIIWLAEKTKLGSPSKDLHAYYSAYLKPDTYTKHPPFNRSQKINRSGIRWEDDSFSMSKLSLTTDTSGHESAFQGKNSGDLTRASVESIAGKTIIVLAPEYITNSEAKNFVGHRFYVDKAGLVHNRIHPTGKIDISTNDLSIQTPFGVVNYSLSVSSDGAAYLVCTSGPNKGLLLRIVALVEGDPFGLASLTNEL